MKGGGDTDKGHTVKESGHTDNGHTVTLELAFHQNNLIEN